MDRKTWLTVIAHADKDELVRLWEAANLPDTGTWLRAPEIGLLPIQARVGNSGDKFLFGDTTMTRAVIRLQGKTGYAFILGRNKTQAKCAAMIDALMQHSDYKQRIQTQILAPLAAATEQQHAAHQAKISDTTVDFFTMVRGE